MYLRSLEQFQNSEDQPFRRNGSGVQSRPGLQRREGHLSKLGEFIVLRETLQLLEDQLTNFDRQLRSALEQQSKRPKDLSQFLNSTPVATILLDDELRLAACNARSRLHFELTESDIGRPLAEVAPKFYDRDLPNDLREANSSGAISRRVLQSAAGEWYLRAIIPYHSETHGLLAAAVIFSAITRCAETQTAAALACSYFEPIIQLAETPLALADASSSLIVANEAFHSALGALPGMVDKISLVQLDSQYAIVPPLVALISTFLASEKPAANAEITVTYSSGEIVSWRLTMRALLIPPQQRLVVLALGNIADQQHRLLEQASTVDALSTAQRAAEEADKAKSHLLAAAVHDMLQPLQSIRLLLGVLEQQVVNPQARLTLSRLGDASEQMAELIDSLLDLHQIETGRIAIDLTNLSVASLMAQVCNDFSPLAAAKALDLRFVPSNALINGDRRLLTRILGNLLSNAVKYTDKGKLLIGCRRRGADMRIEVWDTGIGIPLEKVNAMFEEFRRGNQSDNTRPGLGLGLHIVKRFSELLNYQIDIRSTPGKGTMVAVLIPDAKMVARPNVKVPDSEHVAASTPSLLLIEDDATQRTILVTFFQQQGYLVTPVRNANEALGHCRDHAAYHPTIIVTEFNLPGDFSGVDVVRHLRHEFNEAIPAVILSGRHEDADLLAGADGESLVLSKPVKLGSLFTTVEALVRRSMPSWRAHSATRRAVAELPSTSDSRSEIAIIDGEPSVRLAVQAAMECQGYKVETFGSAEAFLAEPEHGRFQCLIADIALAGMGGLELQSCLKQEARRPPIIFLTGAGDIGLAVRAMREGAADFLEKPVDYATLKGSVSRAVELDAASEPSQSQVAEVEARLALLTKRERQIMDRIVVGQLNKNIAFDLCISERTTEHHRQSIMRKMGVKSVAMLVRMIAEVERKRN